jgi:hypothetical protein
MLHCETRIKELHAQALDCAAPTIGRHGSGTASPWFSSVGRRRRGCRPIRSGRMRIELGLVRLCRIGGLEQFPAGLLL